MSEAIEFFLKGPISQWHPCVIDDDGTRYNCAEQYMMAGKARLFGDNAMLARIMACDSPYEQKLMGMRVRGFDDELWIRHREEIVYQANWLKFSQNSGLAKKLLRTGDAILAEANPQDVIWAIGLSADDPRAADPGEWRGENLLGEILMRIRDRLRDEMA